MTLSRRRALNLIAGVAAAGATRRLIVPVSAQDAERHGMSAFGDLGYPADFANFKYVDVGAPKGGAYSEIVTSRGYNGSFLTFNSLNAYILKGEGVFGMDYTFAPLMVRAFDEPDAMYGLVARNVRISDNGLTYRFTLRPEVKFHDGAPLTAHDVAWSVTTLKDKGHPIITQFLRDCLGAEALDERTVVVRFAEKRARDVPLFVASLPIFSRAYYSKKPFDESTLDVPIGSGPYKVGRFEVGHFIEFERIKNWWGADLPVARGLYNFDTIRYEYYRDRDVGFEGFTAKNYLFREEFTSRTWATRYDFPAFRDGRVKRTIIQDATPSGAQGWFINTRREKFKDRRLREALIDAFDFEWTNKNIMYGSYDRTQSVFENSPMKASGKPSAAEVTLLEPFRSELPEEVFGEAYVPPVTDGTGQDRRSLRHGAQLLNDAGFMLKNGKRVLPNGSPITIEFLLDESALQQHHFPYIKNLGTLGIDASLRVVDPVQYRKRVDDFDFDITVDRLSFPSTPGDTLRNYFSSQAAAIKGSLNHAGIADPAVDRLIDVIIAANTREEMTTACRALDRVIRSGRYWIPHWYKASHWIAYWDVFDRPAAQPRYFRGIPDTWWYNRDKAGKLDRKG
jgi:microcin C transport system substrate-binding protein